MMLHKIDKKTKTFSLRKSIKNVIIETQRVAI